MQGDRSDSFPSQRIYKLNLDTAQWMKIASEETNG